MKARNDYPTNESTDDLRATILREIEELTDDQLKDYAKLISSLKRGERQERAQAHCPGVPLTLCGPLS